MASTAQSLRFSATAAAAAATAGAGSFDALRRILADLCTRGNPKVYHPNIDEHGRLYLDTPWYPATTILHILIVLYARFFDPDADDPIDFEIARVYKTKRIEYEEKARAWTKKFATANQKSATDWSQFLKDHKIGEPLMYVYKKKFECAQKEVAN